MTIKRVLILPVIAAMMLTSAGGFAGQESVKRGFSVTTSDGSAGEQFEVHFGDPSDGHFFRLMDDKLVKGAPYSAQAVTESVQTLADGNRIVRRSTTALYRDSEGRTRREDSIKGFAASGDDQARMVFINDPVAGVSYHLDTRLKTAHKMPKNSITWTSGDGNSIEKVIKIEHKMEHKINKIETTAGKTEQKVHVEVVPDHHGSPGVFVQSGDVALARRAKADKGVKESLGKQMFDGVEAEGTRTTVTIAAGEIGNEGPINIVSERWYSPELQITVMTRHSDPRLGETTYRLTGINRSEPARSLFEPPSDYSIETGPAEKIIRKKKAPEEQ